MSRLRTLDSIAKSLANKDNRLIVAVEPDHPLLFSGPDLLAGWDGRLATLYLPKVRELRKPDLLLARLAIARLALPATMRAALLIGNLEGSELLGGLVHRDFDEVIDINEQPSVVRFVLDRQNRRSEDISTLQNIKRGAIARFETLYSFSYEQFLDGKRGASKAEIIESFPGIRSLSDPLSWTGRAGTSKLPQLYQAEDATVSFLQLGKRSTLEKMRPFCIASLMLNYSLDSGIPYPRSYTLNMMFSETVPVSQFDPLKPIRAAAFAGWAVSTVESGEEAQRQIDELKQRASENLR